MELYVNTVQVVFGILTPIIAIIILVAAVMVYLANQQTEQERLKRDTEKYKKTAPYDRDAEFYEVPNPTMIGVRLKKDGEVVWDGGIDKDKLENS